MDGLEVAGTPRHWITLVLTSRDRALTGAKVVEIVVRFPGTGSKVRFRGSGWRDVPLRVDCSKRSRKRPRVVKDPK